MRGILVFMLGCLFLTLPCTGIDITGGNPSVVVIGEGTMNSSGGTAPIYDPAYKEPKSIIDPSKLSGPNLGKMPDIPEIPTQNNSASTSDETDETSYLRFQSNSTVQGKGDYSEWRSVETSAGLSFKQTNKITRGDTELSSVVALYDNTNNYDESLSTSSAQAAFVSKDHLQFTGYNYRGSQKFLNGNDYISNSFNTNRTLKNSLFFGNLFQRISDTEDEELGAVRNRSTTYNLEAGFIGASNLDFRLNNTIISENYNGGFVLNMKLKSEDSYNLTSKTDHWIPCCGNFTEHAQSIDLRSRIDHKIY